MYHQIQPTKLSQLIGDFHCSSIILTNSFFSILTTNADEIIEILTKNLFFLVLTFFIFLAKAFFLFKKCKCNEVFENIFLLWTVLNHSYRYCWIKSSHFFAELPISSLFRMAALVSGQSLVRRNQAN